MNRNTLMSAIGALCLTAVTASAGAESATLIWSAKSSSISNSTAALSSGHLQRAIKLASDALATAKGPDRVIALHNLCLAHLRQDDAAAATAHCTAALSEAPESLGAKTERMVVSNIENARRAQSAEATAR